MKIQLSESDYDSYSKYNKYLVNNQINLQNINDNIIIHCGPINYPFIIFKII